KLDALNYIKPKTFCASKDTSNRMKRHPARWVRLCTNHTTDKGIRPIIYKEFLQFTSKKATKPFFKWAKDFNKHFSKEYIQKTDAHVKRCSTSLIIRQMRIKTMMRYHRTPVRMAIIKNQPGNKCW
ncbi:LORF2 protein, partial [Crocuta crocuta]